MGKIIGIDLGTTNSCVAVMEGGEPVVITNSEGARTTPSVVSFQANGERLVGQIAKRQAITNPEHTIISIKREMGTDHKTHVDDKVYSPQEISAMILQKIKADAEAYLGEPVTQAVITVPAYFNDKQRKATERAGKLAGLKVERIVNEPTAAAIAYGLHNKKNNTKFLVFDLGGGTLDVSILEIYKNIMEVRAVSGDNYLGGEDFTNLIVEEFYKEHGLTEESLSLKEKSYYRNQAEKSKCNATGDGFYRMQASVNGEKVETLIPRGAFEKMSSQLLDRIKTPVRSLSDAGVKAREIDEVVLVGGTTKMPLVRKFVGKLFGRVPDTSINPDEAVALGAAIQAAMKERKEAVKEVILTDVCPFTLGTEVSVKAENDHIEGNHFCPIIERNTVIPASRTQHFFTVYDHQTQVEIHILQGESRFASNNVSLGTLKLTVPDNEAGKEQIDITYTYDINALLEVEAKIVSTGETVTRLIKNQENSMTEEEMKARMRELSYLKIPPREQEKNKVLLLRGERLYEETTGELREQLEMVTQQFERILDRQDPLKIEEARKDYEEALDWIEEEMWI